MDIVKAKDCATMLKHYLDLMWGVHSTYEDIDEATVTLYKIGLQTFLLKAIDEAKELVEALDEADD